MSINKNKINITLIILFLFFSFFLLKSIEESMIENNGSIVFIKQREENTKFKDKNFVFITGAIKNPGVYQFIEGYKISDIIQKAGGFTKDADLIEISIKMNLSEKVVDQQKIFIPFIKLSKEYNHYNYSNKNINRDSDYLTISNNKEGKININIVSEKDLEKLPGIGPVISKRIIQYRPFEDIEDIKKVPGISENKFNQIKDLITI